MKGIVQPLELIDGHKNPFECIRGHAVGGPYLGPNDLARYVVLGFELQYQFVLAGFGRVAPASALDIKHQMDVGLGEIAVECDGQRCEGVGPIRRVDFHEIVWVAGSVQSVQCGATDGWGIQ